MTFAEAEQQLLLLRERRRLGQLPDAEYIEAVNALRVIDDEQAWWQPDPYCDGWLCWDGAAWQAATPPAYRSASVPASDETDLDEDESTSVFADDEADLDEDESAASDTTNGSASVPASDTTEDTAPKKGFNEWAADIKQQVRAQAADPQTFLRMARTLPLSRRPESWWNALSIFGGAISGYFCFVYGSVSGLPTPGFLLGTPLAKYSRFIVPLALLFLPILMLMFRQRSAAIFAGIQRKFGGYSLKKKLVLLIGIPVVLYYFPQIYTVIFFRLPFVPRLPFLSLGLGEGVEIITPLMMAGLPVAFIYLRRPIDGFLARYKLHKIPAPLRIGIGIALPFLTAYLLFKIGIREYPLLRVNVLLGTALSYMMVRTPRLLTPSGKTPLPIPAMSSILMCLGLAALALLLVDPALADCFLQDPFNFNDGLRTPNFGVAPILAGVATTTVSILVNGVEIARTVIQNTEKTKEGEEEKHTKFWVKVEVQDAKGIRSSRLSPKETEPLFVFAHCEDEQGLFPKGDPTIKLTVSKGMDWVIATEENVPNNRCWRLVMPDPQPKTPLPESVEIVISAGDGVISVPIHLSLDVPTSMRVEMVNGNTFAGEGRRNYTVYDAWIDSEKKGWRFGELVIYWCKLEDTHTPISTGYTPTEWTLAVKPDYFVFDPLTPTSDDGNLTWRTHAALKPDIKIPNDWLETDGIIEVRVSCRTTTTP